MSLLPIESLVPSDLRASIRAQMAAYPSAPVAGAADEIADLIVLAVSEAISAIDRVASSGSNFGVRMAVLSGAGSTTKAVLDRLEGALTAFAKDQGGTIYSTTISMGAGQ